MNRNLKDFIDFILEGNEDETYYTTLVARPKYLTAEERSTIKSNHNMLDIKLCKPKKDVDIYDNYSKMIYRFNCNPSAYLDKKGQPLPSKCKVVYAGLNPVDILLATKKFRQELAELEFRAIESNGDIAEVYSRIPRLFLKNCVNSQKRKRIIDVDVDVEIEDTQLESIDNFLDYLKEITTEDQFNNLAVVFTRGGFHVLSKTSAFNKNFHTETIRKIAVDFFPKAKEVKINENKMCPLPGTNQGDFYVSFFKPSNIK